MPLIWKGLLNENRMWVKYDLMPVLFNLDQPFLTMKSIALIID